MSHTSQKFRLFHASNLSVLNFRISLLIYPGSMSPPAILMPIWSVTQRWRRAVFLDGTRSVLRGGHHKNTHTHTHTHTHTRRHIVPGYMNRTIRKFRTDNFDTCNKRKFLLKRLMQAVYMSCMSQNFRLLHVSKLSVRNLRIFLLMYNRVIHLRATALRKTGRRADRFSCWHTSAGGANRNPKISEFKICPNSYLELGRTMAHSFGLVRTVLNFGQNTLKMEEVLFSNLCNCRQVIFVNDICKLIL